MIKPLIFQTQCSVVLSVLSVSLTAISGLHTWPFRKFYVQSSSFPRTDGVILGHKIFTASLVAQLVKNLLAVQETRVWSLGSDDPLEKEMATHSSILAWKISWTKEPRGLQYMELQRVRHDWATNTNTKDPICHNKDWRFLIPHNWHNQINK